MESSLWSESQDRIYPKFSGFFSLYLHPYAVIYAECSHNHITFNVQLNDFFLFHLCYTDSLDLSAYSYISYP